MIVSGRELGDPRGGKVGETAQRLTYVVELEEPTFGALQPVQCVSRAVLGGDPETLNRVPMAHTDAASTGMIRTPGNTMWISQRGRRQGTCLGGTPWRYSPKRVSIRSSV